MTLQSRITRLEAQNGAKFLTDSERESAIDRYVNTHRAIGKAFPLAMNPAAYRTAIEAPGQPGTAASSRLHAAR